MGSSSISDMAYRIKSKIIIPKNLPYKQFQLFRILRNQKQLNPGCSFYIPDNDSILLKYINGGNVFDLDQFQDSMDSVKISKDQVIYILYSKDEQKENKQNIKLQLKDVRSIQDIKKDVKLYGVNICVDYKHQEISNREIMIKMNKYLQEIEGKKDLSFPP